jgi:hypothetical protein
MVLSIQEYLKKINSLLRIADIISLTAVVLVVICVSIWYAYVSQTQEKPLIFTMNREQTGADTVDNTLPFGSRNGKTYTYSWCKNASAIKEKNKIVFASQVSAQKSGRVLSKLCK